MEMKLLHQQSVPCLVDVRKDKSKERGGNIRYYLNPSVLLRYEPEGAIIVPQKLEHSFMFIDKELAALLKKRSFLRKELLNNSIKILIDYEIISVKEFKDRDYREYFINESNLPIHALLDVTAKCNCACDMCYHKEDLKCKNCRINTEKIKCSGFCRFSNSYKCN